MMREQHAFERKHELREQQKTGYVKRDNYEIIEHDERERAPEERTGNFFLNRYHLLDPSVRLVDLGMIEQALRVHTLRTSAQTLIDALLDRNAKFEKIPFLKNGYYVKASFSLGSTPEYLLGHYYLQAPLSQLACEVLRPTPGMTVLDMAAAPGSKTTYLATMVVGDNQGAVQGKVIALDNNPDRLAAVRNNAERLGLTNVICVKKDARFADDFGMKFDSVLLDAPCSGNFCSEKDWCSRRTLADIQANAKTQRELIKTALACLAPGGRLVYSTCSLEPEEDEMVVDYALKRDATITIIPLNTVLPSDLGDDGVTSWNGVALDPHVAGTRRFWPHKTGMEGFFIALFEKKR